MRGRRSLADGGVRVSHARRQEARLIKQAKQGDRRAMGQLYRRTVDEVYRYIYARVARPDVAEDLTAQVFLKVVEGLPEYQERGKPFVAWLYVIARARVVDWYRDQERRAEVELVEELEATDLHIEQRLVFEAEWQTAVQMIAQLTEDQQDVVLLRFMGEKSLAEVAEALGKTVGAVKALQFRAMTNLGRMWEQHEAADESRS